MNEKFEEKFNQEKFIKKKKEKEKEKKINSPHKCPLFPYATPSPPPPTPIPSPQPLSSPFPTLPPILPPSPPLLIFPALVSHTLLPSHSTAAHIFLSNLSPSSSISPSPTLQLHFSLCSL